jgi:hypothetical protein
MAGHWHVVPAAHALGVEAEHRAWHEGRLPCVLCGRIAFTVWTEGPHTTSSGLPLYPCYGRIPRSKEAQHG